MQAARLPRLSLPARQRRAAHRLSQHRPSRSCRAASPDTEPSPPANPLLVGVVAGTAAVLLAVAVSSLSSPEGSLDDALFDGAGVSPGDVLGSLLWSVSLYYASPLQLLLLFLGRIDVERPSDGTLRFLGLATGQPVDEASYTAPMPLQLANFGLFLIGGSGIAAACSSALGGEATWSVSTGIGACLAAAVYELGRPQRLSAVQQVTLEAEWSDFRAFADAKLVRSGRCHASEIEKAYRQYSPTYRARASRANAAGDADLRNFVANWAPGADRTSAGFYKGVSLMKPPAEATQTQPQ